MKNILKKYYKLDEETKEVLPFLYMYQELISAIENFPDIKIKNMYDEEILMQTIIKCWYSTDLEVTNIVDKILSILNCQDITIKDFENIELDELLELISDEDDAEILSESEISEDEESVLEFTCRGYHCIFFKEQDKYFLILVNGDDTDILIFNSIEEILGDSIEKFLLEQRLYGKPKKFNI